MTQASSPQELIYLWEQGNIPTTTEYTENTNAQYFDPPDFRPNMVYFPAKEGVKVKGAVLICPGVRFNFAVIVRGRPLPKRSVSWAIKVLW
jgi:hypothetical protein